MNLAQTNKIYMLRYQIQKDNLLMMKNIYFVLTVLSLLLPSHSQIGWQGYGNLSASNLTAIWGYINNNIQTAVAQDKYDDFSTGLSTNLNTLWDPAWNVITIQSVSTSDSILYGYAFRSHWMWYNNYKVGQKSLSFVIWKDYNCMNWKNVGTSYPTSTFQSNNLASLSSSLSTVFPSNTPITNIWLQAKTFLDSLSTISGFSGMDKAFSIVASQDGSQTSFYGRVCLASQNWIQTSMSTNSNSTINGLFLLFQTRSYSVNSNLLLANQVASFITAQLQKHNQYRAKHGCSPLSINSTLTDIAQNYSEYLATQVHDLKHSDPAKSGTYGQNLYWGWGSPTLTYASGKASESWYSEQSKYVYNSFPPASGTGHFTAMIWKAVTSVGFGYFKVQQGGGYAIYVTANYYPTPNMYSSANYQANVPTP